MFNCENMSCETKGSQPAHQPVNYIVTETRPMVYKKEIYKFKNREKLIEIADVYGQETVKEIKVCPPCFRELTGNEPLMQTPKTELPKKRTGFNRPSPHKKWTNPRSRGRSAPRLSPTQRLSENYKQSRIKSGASPTGGPRQKKSSVIVEKINTIKPK